jgi:hypothetical protein
VSKNITLSETEGGESSNEKQLMTVVEDEPEDPQNRRKKSQLHLKIVFHLIILGEMATLRKQSAPIICTQNREENTERYTV